MGKSGFFGRLAKRCLDKQGLLVLYCGYQEIPNPVPEFTFKKRRVIPLPTDTPIRTVSEAELNGYIASWTSWFAGWPVPLDAIPLAKSAAVDDPIGGMGILTTTMPGIARYHAGDSGKIFALSMSSQAVIPVPQWSLTGVESLSVVLHQIPPGAVLSEMPAETVTALIPLPPFGHLGIQEGMAKNSPPDNPARFYREAVRQVCLRYQSLVGSNTQDDARFLAYLAQRYREEKEHISRLMQEGLPEQQEPLARLGLLILAVGLFTYGRLDTVEDILDSIPPSELRVGRLAWSLNGMLPLPASIREVQRDREAVRAWFRVNKTALRWNEQQGVYVLASC